MTPPRIYWIITTGGARRRCRGRTLEHALSILGLTIWQVARWGIVE